MTFKTITALPTIITRIMLLYHIIILYHIIQPEKYFSLQENHFNEKKL